jgi:hypothetical protein
VVRNGLPDPVEQSEHASQALYTSSPTIVKPNESKEKQIQHQITV